MTSSELVGWSFTSWSWPPGRPPAPPPTSEKVAPASLVTQDTSPTPTKKRREGSLGLSRMDLTPERTRFSASLPTCASPSRRAFNLLMTLTHVLPSSALRNTAFLSVRRKMICGGAAGPRGRAQGVSGERGGLRASSLPCGLVPPTRGRPRRRRFGPGGPRGARIALGALRAAAGGGGPAHLGDRYVPQLRLIGRGRGPRPRVVLRRVGFLLCPRRGREGRHQQQDAQARHRVLMHLGR